MSGRGDVYRFEPPRFFRGLASLGHLFASALKVRNTPAFLGLRPSIPSLVAGESIIARDLYRGHLKIANTLLRGQLQRLLSPPTNPLVTDALLSLCWLPHLAVADMSLYRGYSRYLYNLCARERELSPDVICRRLMILSRHADFLLADASEDFIRKFYCTVSREARTLKQTRMQGAQGELCQALSLLAVSIAFRGAEDLRAGALDRAAAAIPAVIVADGGHVSRNPQALLALLVDLVPLLEKLRTYRSPIPPSLVAAVERAYPFLRMMCHADGGLALFQGVDNTSEAAVAAVLACDPHHRSASRHAIHSGYARLDRGKSVVIMDAGQEGVYRSALAFEFSHGNSRIVTNCGTPVYASPAWRLAAISAAAHSGLQFLNPDRRKFPSFLDRLIQSSSSETPQAEVAEGERGLVVRATRIQTEAFESVVHQREIFLANSGYCLQGEDRFTQSRQRGQFNSEIHFTLRFHLDPTVKAFSGRSGSAIMLMLPNRGVWQFSASGAKVMLEDSVMLAGSNRIQNSQQIVIRDVAACPGRINWSFQRVEKPVRQPGSGDDNPRLPF